MKQPLNALIVKEGEGAQDAVALGDGIFMSRGISNSYLVTTSEGDVLVNTGMAHEAPEITRRFAAVSNGPLRIIVFTQGHADHVGGWSQFDGPDVETIVQANHADVREYWTRSGPYYSNRTEKLWRTDLADIDRSHQPPEPVITTTFLDRDEFTLGGRRFELLATPGGETTDSLVVWLPEVRTVFTGNLMGPLFGHVPNLYTPRGDKYRSAVAYVHALDRVLALEPEVLVTGHGEPIRGADEIHQRVQQVRDATEWLRDRTIEGMNAGVDLFTLMDEVSLPSELDVPQGHGKVPWIVRAVWEEHSGWFRYESTTELYTVPPSAIWPELTELAGGTDVLLRHARAHLDAGRPLEALHFVDMVLAVAPDDAGALETKLGALRLLLERSGRENFSEVRWLEAEIRDTEAVLAWMHPRLSVSEMCTYPLPFGEELALWDELGVRQVGLLTNKVDTFGRAAAIAAMTQRSMRATTVITTMFDLSDPTSWDTTRAAVNDSIDLAAEVGGCTYFTPGRRDGRRFDELAASLADAVAPCAKYAESCGVTLAIEPSLRTDVSFVHTLRDGTDVAERAGIGVIADVGNCWMERDPEDAVRRAGARLAVFQLSDAVYGTFERPSPGGRVVPGDGDLALDGYLRAALDAGYTGAFELEVVGPAIESEGHAAALRRAVVRANELLYEVLP